MSELATQKMGRLTPAKAEKFYFSAFAHHQDDNPAELPKGWKAERTPKPAIMPSVEPRDISRSTPPRRDTTLAEDFRRNSACPYQSYFKERWALRPATYARV
jgi:hypothetical protein